MRVLMAVVLAIIFTSCKSTSGGRYEMRAAAFVVPTFDEDKDSDNGDDSASVPASECDQDHAQAGECVERTRSAKSRQSLEEKAAR